MEAFGMIELKPTKKRTVTITHVQNTNPEFIIQGIPQPKPHLQKVQPSISQNQLNEKQIHSNVHILYRGKHKRAESAHLQPSSIIIKSTEKKKIFNSKKQNDNQKYEQSMRTVRPKRPPIFDDQAHEERMNKSQILSIHLSQTDESISESSEKYFLTSAFRKPKGYDQPYAQTYRVKNTKKSTDKKQEYLEPKSFIRKFQQQSESDGKKFRKKRIFHEAKTEIKYQESSKERPRRKIFDQQTIPNNLIKQEDEIKQKHKFIKLKHKRYKKASQVQAQQQLLSHPSSCQSLEVYSFEPILPMQI